MHAGSQKLAVAPLRRRRTTRIGSPYRRLRWLPGAVALTVLMAGFVAPRPVGATSDARIARASSGPRSGSLPNVLLLVTDDQSWNTFDASLMPNVWSSIVDKGVLFDRFYVNQSECCPSRSELLSGLYAQHTGVDGNDVQMLRPTIVQALHDQGYRTMLSGKFLNSEPCGTVWPGFDRWVCEDGTDSPHTGQGMVNPTLNVDGTWTRFKGYTTDILANDVTDFISATPPGQPWFAMYTPESPHLPANDPRCDSSVPGVRDPGYFDDTMSDGKPAYLRRGPLTSSEAASVDADHQEMTNAVQCLDGSIGIMLDYLAANGLEPNTLVVFTSDNGYLYGEHRRAGKVVPYEESVRVPTAIRYPPLVPEGQSVVTDALAQNVDIAPTVADLAGLPWGADGTSLAPVLADPTATVRDSVLIENCEGASYPCPSPSPELHPELAADLPLAGTRNKVAPPFTGIVNAQYKYVAYETGERELYDFAADPYEITNLGGSPSYAQVEATLASDLQALLAPPPVETTIVAGPIGAITSRVATFTYFSQDRHASYQCRLTGTGTQLDWFNCNGGSVTIGGLTDGAYTLEVQGADSDGAVDPTPASRTFSIASTGPDASIASAPAAHQQASSLTFSFTSLTQDATFSCSMVPFGASPSFTGCASGVSYPNEPDGLWDFQVEATDPATGETTNPPSEWLTHVDNMGPRMELTRGLDLATPSKHSRLAFDFFPDEPTQGPFTCQLDAAPQVDCSLGGFMAKSLADGAHALVVRATDTIGNVGTTTFGFTIDAHAPTVTFVQAPPPATTQTSATLAWTTGEPATFRCKLDVGSSLLCTSPQSVSDLTEAKHTYTVRATDGAGNSGAFKVTWTVDLTPPTVTISSGPPPVTNRASATFRWSTMENNVTHACALDGGPPAGCASPITYQSLADGMHDFSVTPTDAAGNVGTPAVWDWTVDTTPPVTTITSGPPATTTSTTATFTFASDDPAAVSTCSLDGAPFTSCMSPTTYSAMALGPHTLVARFTDPAGNVGASNPWPWTVVMDIRAPGRFR